jgi:maleylpyruvate isomerase
MTSVARDIEGCRESHRRLLKAIDGLTDEHARRPSLLPGWTVGHVLTHLARNADSVVRRLEGAARGEIVDQYPGGAAGRAADIDNGADRSAADLVADVAGTCAAVETTCDSVPPDAWGNLTRAVGGEEEPAHRVVFSRWREVEVHHVDLGLGYSPADWPADLVGAWLPPLVRSLPDRTDPNALLAWILGRGPAPELTSWG